MAESATARLREATADLCPWPICDNSHAELLINGPQTYDAMLDAIAGAEHVISLTTFVFGDDEVGNRFADALLERAGAGVKVFVLVDSYGSRNSGGRDGVLVRMASGGIVVVEFNEINPAAGGDIATINSRMHRKLLLVDRRIGFTGGVNFHDEYLEDAGDDDTPGWRDTHISLTGPALLDLERVFLRGWPAEAPARDYDYDHLPEPDATGDDAVGFVLADSGDEASSAIFEAYRRAMQAAEDCILITQAYFVPHRDFLAELEAAAERGVDVRLIVAGRSDVTLVIHASQSRYGRLLRSGVRIYENRRTVLHAKTAVIDGAWSTVGSSNLDNRSFELNGEANAMIYGERFGALMAEQFEKDLGEVVEIKYADWRRRPLTYRLLELVARLFERWL